MKGLSYIYTIRQSGSGISLEKVWRKLRKGKIVGPSFNKIK